MIGDETQVGVGAGGGRPAWSAMRWAVIGAVVGGIFGAAVAAAGAGAFTPTGPGVSTGSYPGVLAKVQCTPDKMSSLHPLYKIPDGTVFVPGEVWAAPLVAAELWENPSGPEAGGDQISAHAAMLTLLDGARFLGGPVFSGSTLYAYCSGAQGLASGYTHYVRGTLERK